MSGTNVGSLVGTWVAAIVALIALIGVAGPLLVWRAARTQRNQALASLGPDTKGFISAGLHVGPNLYIWKQVRAPDLRKTPVFGPHIAKMNHTLITKSKSPCSWVHFSTLLAAYRLRYDRGDVLHLAGGTSTYLPVHRCWVLFLGIIGRYGTRRDRNQIFDRRQTPMRLAPGTVIYGETRQEDGHGNGYLRIPENRTRELSGLSGRIIDHSDPHNLHLDHLEFDLPSQEMLAGIPDDTLPLPNLFLLASGCLPLRIESHYFSLFESEDRGEAWGSDTSESEVPVTHHRSRRYRTRPEEVLINDRTGKDVYIYELVELSDLDPTLSAVSRPFQSEEPTMFGFRRSQPSRETRKMLIEYETFTYLPADSIWVRLQPVHSVTAPDLNPVQDFHGCYISRSDAQAVAYALLHLEWHSEGYLIGSDKAGAGLQLLLIPGGRLQPMLFRLAPGVAYLSLSDSQRVSLTKAINRVVRMLQKSDVYPSRLLSQTLYSLDCQLADLTINEPRILRVIVGLLVMTNEEFQMLLQQSLRHVQEAAPSDITVDPRQGTLMVPSAFGVLQRFVVDLDSVEPDLERDGEPFFVSYTAVILAATKAALRSTMLRYSFDSEPLFKAVLSWPEVVYVA